MKHGNFSNSGQGKSTENKLGFVSRLSERVRSQNGTWLWGALIVGILAIGIFSLIPESKTEAQAATQLSKEYLYAGSRMLAVEEPGAPLTPPAAPASLTGSAASATSVALTWSDSSTNEANFVVQRCTGAGCTTFATVAGGVVAAGVTSFTDTGLTSGTVYRYQVGATNAAGTNFSPIFTITAGVPTAPPAPTSLTGTVLTTTSISLLWSNTTNENNFLVERCSGATCTNFVLVAGGTLAADVLTFNNTGLTNGTTYRYRIGAMNAVGTNYSPILTIRAGTPTAPTMLASPSKTNTTINLTWVDTSNNEANFAIQRCTGSTNCTPVAFTTVGANVFSFSNTGLTPNTIYRYRVRATNLAGNSAFSNTITVTTNP